jgi:hypothetical protein
MRRRGGRRRGGGKTLTKAKKDRQAPAAALEESSCHSVLPLRPSKTFRGMPDNQGTWCRQAFASRFWLDCQKILKFFSGKNLKRCGRDFTPPVQRGVKGEKADALGTPRRGRRVRPFVHSSGPPAGG